MARAKRKQKTKQEDLSLQQDPMSSSVKGRNSRKEASLSTKHKWGSLVAKPRLLSTMSLFSLESEYARIGVQLPQLECGANPIGYFFFLLGWVSWLPLSHSHGHLWIFVNEVYQGVVSELILMYFCFVFLKQPDAFNVHFSCVYFMFSI